MSPGKNPKWGGRFKHFYQESRFQIVEYPTQDEIRVVVEFEIVSPEDPQRVERFTSKAS